MPICRSFIRVSSSFLVKPLKRVILPGLKRAAPRSSSQPPQHLNLSFPASEQDIKDAEVMILWGGIKGWEEGEERRWRKTRLRRGIKAAGRRRRLTGLFSRLQAGRLRGGLRLKPGCASAEAHLEMVQHCSGLVGGLGPDRTGWQPC